MSRDIAPVLVTVDRSPGKNYLGETLDNLWRGGLGPSERVVSFPTVASPLFISDSGSGDWSARVAEQYLGDYWTCVNGHDEHACANLNVANALRVGAGFAPWVLFLEDDIDVCADFFDSVGAWLDDHAREDRRIYAFGANYRWVEEAMAAGRSATDYPISQFYGTQALALRSEDALSLSTYLVEHCYDRTDDGTAYDLLMADWARETWPEIRYFLASAPSFVQHIGRTSSIRPRAETHTFPSWPGRDWSYIERRAA